MLTWYQIVADILMVAGVVTLWLMAYDIIPGRHRRDRNE